MFLDTCFLVDLIREKVRSQRGPAIQKLESLGESEVRISVFVLCELRAGAEMSSDPVRELARVAALAETYPVVYPDSTFPGLFGKTLAAMARSGIPVPMMDLMVAVTAKKFGMPVLTRDVEHFGKIPGLTVITY